MTMTIKQSEEVLQASLRAEMQAIWKVNQQPYQRLKWTEYALGAIDKATNELVPGDRLYLNAFPSHKTIMEYAAQHPGKDLKLFIERRLEWYNTEWGEWETIDWATIYAS